ncbi:hypothetical protein [Salinibacter ruber]|uniref:Uncharacterized protein n=1 Tax=Salinibacter ruber TaxID=146919 RepID=A0A9X2Q5S1_9BACT|nr:hypothetical protein [Salinibacter ruber]MCS3662016.1 hypothetical protein [Salinibacter ruber]MCS3711811.1 hypothetical protein [Salinibacter ruber]MCS4119381.1 hypothetical protein [Salinibacter ruber]MCS4142654.1 hypothetical protein [Salinibacter ruber]
MDDTISASRDLTYEAEKEQLNREYAQKRAQLEKKHAREHGKENDLHGAAADTHWTYSKYGSPRARDQEMIKEGMRVS